MPRLPLLAGCLLVFSSLALAAPPKRPAAPKAPAPAPCLAAPAPKTAPSLELDGAAAPLSVATLVQQQRSSDGSVVFRLRFADEEFRAPRTVSLNLRLKKGEVFAGRTFEQRAGADMKDQPDVIATDVSWTPRVSAVTIVSAPDGVEYDYGVASTVRVVFGKQADDALTGTVQLCIEPGQRDDTFQKTPTRRVSVQGTFAVDVSSLTWP